MINLRPEQIEASDSALKQLNTENSSLLVLPPRSGKTYIIADIASKFSGSVLILANQNKLVKQAQNSLLKFVDSVGIYNAGLSSKDLSQRVTIGSIQSVWKLSHQFDLIILDEAHRFDERKGMWRYFLTTQQSCKVLGVTATPFTAREYIYGANRLFKYITYEKSFQEMTKLGRLVPLHHSAGKHQINVNGVKITAGEYNIGELETVIMSDREKIKSQVADTLEKRIGPTIFVCVSIEHANAVHSLVPNSTIIHSQARNELPDDWEFVVSVMMLSEGVDLPRAQTISFMRPTRSPTLYIQAAARVLTQYDGKEYGLLLDYGHVVENLGSIYNARPDSKDHLKICIECEKFSPSHFTHCFYCDTEFLKQCPECFTMLKMSETCPTCEKRKQAARDLLGGLSLKSANPCTAYKISKVVTSIYVKNGISMLKVSYLSGFSSIVSTYWDIRNKNREYYYERFLSEHTDCEEFTDIQDLADNPTLVRTPDKIHCVKDGKYNRIINYEYI